MSANAGNGTGEVNLYNSDRAAAFISSGVALSQIHFRCGFLFSAWRHPVGKFNRAARAGRGESFGYGARSSAIAQGEQIEGPVINALRKEVDRRQLEFVKSGKLVPVQFSSRHYDFKRNKWVFGKASEQEIELLLARKVYWQTRIDGDSAWIGDPAEALYVETTSDHLLDTAKQMAAQDLINLEGDRAVANSSLMAQADKFEADMRAALEELEKKHAFERG